MHCQINDIKLPDALVNFSDKDTLPGFQKGMYRSQITYDYQIIQYISMLGSCEYMLNSFLRLGSRGMLNLIIVAWFLIVNDMYAVSGGYKHG